MRELNAPSEQEPPIGVEALWCRTLEAQRGRYFLLKWLIVGGVAGALREGLQLGASLFPPAAGMSFYAPFNGALIIHSTISAALMACLIFGWRWRTYAWAAKALIAASVSVLGYASAPNLNFLYGGLFALIAEGLLLIGVRQRVAVWFLVRPILLLVSFGLAELSRMSPRSAPSLPVTMSPSGRGLNLHFDMHSCWSAFFLLVTGAILAWLMPPVAPSAPACQPATHNE